MCAPTRRDASRALGYLAYAAHELGLLPVSDTAGVIQNSEANPCSQHGSKPLRAYVRRNRAAQCHVDCECRAFRDAPARQGDLPRDPPGPAHGLGHSVDGSSRRSRRILAREAVTVQAVDLWRSRRIMAAA